MPNITPGDVHVKRPLTAYGPGGTVPPPRRGSKKFSGTMDAERRERTKQDKKRKTKVIEYSPDWVEKMYIQKKFHSAKNRRALAAQNKALPDESYPIEDAVDLRNAATLARSGHGNVAAAKRLIARRAKQLGVANPLAAKPTANVAKSLDDIAYPGAVACFARLTK